MSPAISLHPHAPDYPARICDALEAPPVLRAVGNAALLERDAIGICGSRHASEDAREWAERFGRTAVRCGLVVVSGYAKGVDRCAHYGALDAGGAAIAVLPEGMHHYASDGELAAIADDANFLVVSMFPDDTPWKVWNAMERNRIVVALSLGICAIEPHPGGKGGTNDAIKVCRQQGKPYHVLQQSDSPDDVLDDLLARAAARPQQAAMLG